MNLRQQLEQGRAEFFIPKLSGINIDLSITFVSGPFYHPTLALLVVKEVSPASSSLDLTCSHRACAALLADEPCHHIHDPSVTEMAATDTTHPSTSTDPRGAWLSS